MASIVNPPRDPNTLSNYNNFVTTRTIANLGIDFERRCISGNVTLKLKSITDAATKEILLDTSFLNVKEVVVSGRASKWELLSRFEPYGSALKISLEEGVDDGKSVGVNITSETTNDCTGLDSCSGKKRASLHVHTMSRNPRSFGNFPVKILPM